MPHDSLSVDALNSACRAVVALVDAGSRPGLLVLFSGGTTLATLTCSRPAFSDPTDGVATANRITDAIADASGKADRFEFQDGDGNLVIGGTVGKPKDDPGLILDPVNVVQGGIVSIISFIFTVK